MLIDRNPGVVDKRGPRIVQKVARHGPLEEKGNGFIRFTSY